MGEHTALRSAARPMASGSPPGTEWVHVPVRIGPDRGPGDRGFGRALYEWNSAAGRWVYVQGC
jgi:hypothetical protein